MENSQTGAFLLLLGLIFILNLPFGYWRASLKKLSLFWFVAIHLPVVFIILLRYWLNIEHAWTTTPFMVLSFFTGQRVGGWYYKHTHK